MVKKLKEREMKMTNINSYAPQSGRIIGEDGKFYNLVDLLQNVGGGTSMEFLFGSTAPEGAAGKTGDVYLNTTNGDFYKKGDTWAKIGVLMGPQGEQGPQGERGPAGADGTDGVSVVDATSDGVNITFELSNGSTIDVPWPEQ